MKMVILRKKGCLFNEGSVAGIWYYFDKSGKIVKRRKIQMKAMNLNLKILLYTAKKNKINLSKGYNDSGYQTRVLKQDFEGKKYGGFLIRQW